MTLILPFHYSLHLCAQTNYSEPVFGRKQERTYPGLEQSLYCIDQAGSVLVQKQAAIEKRAESRLNWVFKSNDTNGDKYRANYTCLLNAKEDKLHFSIQMSCWGRNKDIVVSGIAMEAKPSHQHAMGPGYSHTLGHRLLLMGRFLSFCLEEALPALAAIGA